VPERIWLTLFLIGIGVSTPRISFFWIARLRGSFRRPLSIVDLHADPWDEEFRIFELRKELLIRGFLKAGMGSKLAAFLRQSRIFLKTYVKYKLEDEFGQTDLIASSGAPVLVIALIRELFIGHVTH
jgi:hypothetical protein